jgi:exonuclease SbcD
MKLLHTADWHAGRTLHGQDRTPEIREVLQEIAELALTGAVDLILVAGDLFDSKNPSAAAEAAVYEFFLTTGARGIPSVVIAGNHDSPSRIDAVSGVLKLAQVHALGEARVSQQGGVFELPLGGEVARIAALPFVSERRIVKVGELLEGDPGAWRERYREGMRKLLQNLTAGFSGDAVNLLMMHTAMDGARLANSEFQFHCTESYSLSADAIPEGVNYAALGHIHMPQGVTGMSENAARYAGSILQLDFGEQGDKKCVYLVEAAPGKPTELREVALQGGKRLKRVKCERGELERRLLELDGFDGWVKLSVELPTPEPGLKERIKREYPNVLIVEQLLPEREREALRGVDHQAMSLLDAYEQFYREERGEALSDELRLGFERLSREVLEPEEERA